MTASPGSPLWDMEVPGPPTAVERLLALAGHAVQHNDMIDMVLFGGGVRAAPDACAASARVLEREAVLSLQAVQQLQLRQTRDVVEAVAPLFQIVHLAGAAARHLSAAQPPPSPDGAKLPQQLVLRHAKPHLRLGRNLTVHAPQTLVGVADGVGDELWRVALNRPGRRPTTDALAIDDRDVLLEAVRGFLSVAEEKVRSRTVNVSRERFSRLEAQGFLTRSPRCAPPEDLAHSWGDRVRLTPDGITALSTALAPPVQKPAPSRPFAIPTTAPTARARR